jgi:hypothetical protein
MVIKCLLIISVTLMFLTSEEDFIRPRPRGGQNKEMSNT